MSYQLNSYSGKVRAEFEFNKENRNIHTHKQHPYGKQAVQHCKQIFKSCHTCQQAVQHCYATLFRVALSESRSDKARES